MYSGLIVPDIKTYEIFRKVIGSVLAFNGQFGGVGLLDAANHLFG